MWERSCKWNSLLRCMRIQQNSEYALYGNDKTQSTLLIDRDDWYYLVENKLRGPISELSMRKNFTDGFLNEKVLVRFGRSGTWFPAGEVPEFKSLFKSPNIFKGSSLRQFGKYLLIVVAVGLCFSVVKAIINKRQGNVVTNKNELTLSPSFQWGLTKSGVIAQTNKARQENGALPSLSENPLLNTIAEERLKDMFKNQYLSSHSPAGEDYTDLAGRVGYKYGRLAENIASGTFRNDEKVVDLWMQSPGHRENILTSDVSEIGVAVGKGFLKGQEVWLSVEILGHPSAGINNEQAIPLQWGLTKSGVIAQTNKARQENGALPLLAENRLLDAVAEERLKDMFKNQYVSHYPPSGEDFKELAIRFGYKHDRLGENLASGVYRNDEKVVDGWLQSPGHRAAILSSEFSEIGVAVGKGFLKGQETWIGVQIFGRPPAHH